MNDVITAQSETVNNPRPKYESTTAIITPAHAEIGVLVELNTSGMISAVRTVFGTYAKNDFKNLFSIFFLKKSRGITRIDIMVSTIEISTM